MDKRYTSCLTVSLCFYFVVQALGKANRQPPVVSELTVTDMICDVET